MTVGPPPPFWCRVLTLIVKDDKPTKAFFNMRSRKEVPCIGASGQNVNALLYVFIHILHSSVHMFFVSDTLLHPHAL